MKESHRKARKKPRQEIPLQSTYSTPPAFTESIDPPRPQTTPPNPLEGDRPNPIPSNVVSASSGTRNTFITIYPGGVIAEDRGGMTFRHRLRQLVDVYFSNIHVYWRDQSEVEKKRVIEQLTEEFGGGWNTKLILNEIRDLLKKRRDNARRHARRPHSMRPVSTTKASWSFLRKEIKSKKTYPIQKRAAEARLAMHSVSHLGRGGKRHFEAQFVSITMFFIY